MISLLGLKSVDCCLDVSFKILSADGTMHQVQVDIVQLKVVQRLLHEHLYPVLVDALHGQFGRYEQIVSLQSSRG